MIFVYTVITATGQMKNEANIEETCNRIASEQLHKYSKLLDELYTRAAIHSIQEMREEDERNYQVWYQSKLADFHNLPTEDSDEILSSFETFDKSGNAMIDEAELKMCLRGQGFTCDDSVIESWFDGVFAKQPGEGAELSRDDFCVLMVILKDLRQVVDDGDFTEWFEDVMDRSGDASIGVEEFMSQLPEVCALLKIDRPYLLELFKRIKNSEDEDEVIEEVGITTFVNWINRLVAQQDNISFGG